MPKAIAYPTDCGLYCKAIKSIVLAASKHGITLRQTYHRLAPRALRKRNCYAHARQMKRANREQRKLHTYLGRVLRDFKRKTEGRDVGKSTRSLLAVAKQVLNQKRSDSKKIYSIHEPHVECIAKGKAHKKYEFGCKASIVLTHKEGLALDVRAIHGNPYDGHTLKSALEHAESNSGRKIRTGYVDKGYRGHKIEDKAIFISGQKRGVTKWIKAQLKRRQAIEPHIGHMKNDGKLDRNYLKCPRGDYHNAILCGIGHNLRLIYNSLFPRNKHRFSG